jgi:hypothetical protein
MVNNDVGYGFDSFLKEHDEHRPVLIEGTVAVAKIEILFWAVPGAILAWIAGQ